VEATYCNHYDNVIIRLLRSNNVKSLLLYQVHSLIVIIRLMLSVYSCPKVITQGIGYTLNTVKVECLVKTSNFQYLSN
jgi:hypothetical protein